MENLEIRAKTVEEAIQQALEQLGVTREEVEVTILSEGKTGILGLGTEEARIRVTPLVPTPVTESAEAETAKSILEKLLAAMGITAGSDALCLVVSEETGTISIAEDGKLKRNITESDLRKTLISSISEMTPIVERFWKFSRKNQSAPQSKKENA